VSHNENSATRRHFLEAMGISAAAGLAAGCGGPGQRSRESRGDQRRLKAAFSNAGLQSTWCALGKTTAELWGDLLDVEVHWFDGEFDPEKQRNKLDQIVDQDWDFCCFQSVAIDSLIPPVQDLQRQGIPVISMDTLLAAPEKMRDVGVWIQVQPDHIFMAESSTRELMRRIGGRGKIIHIGGLSAHSGARDRNQGCENVLREFPEVEVIGGGVIWCDWKKQKARDTFESLLEQESSPIAGAFFHSDDMALACIPALANSIHRDMAITAVDGQKEGLTAVRDGSLAATTVNPVCRIHRTALTIGQFIVRNQESLDEVPPLVITPGPLVTQESGNLEAMFYLADPRRGMV
jgi:ribose transport system substrate-binding protein